MVDHGFGVKLGPITQTPAALLLKWRNSPEIYKWCRQYEPLAEFTHAAWIKSLEAGRPDVKMYSIFGSSPSMHLGACGFTSLDLINRHAEFSLYIAPEEQRRGHGESALKTLCAHGFLALGLRHIFGETFSGNPAAEMFEKVGFQKEGTRREFYFRDGQFIDAHLYSILNTEFLVKWNI